jgi:hypothetical protein
MKNSVRLCFLLLAVVPAYFVVSVAYRRVHEEVVVDQCFSGNHGSFNYSNMSCDLETNHAYVPYRARYSHDLQIFIVALVSFTALVSAYSYIGIRHKKT